MVCVCVCNYSCMLQAKRTKSLQSNAVLFFANVWFQFIFSTHMQVKILETFLHSSRLNIASRSRNTTRQRGDTSACHARTMIASGLLFVTERIWMSEVGAKERREHERQREREKNILNELLFQFSPPSDRCQAALTFDWKHRQHTTTGWTGGGGWGPETQLACKLSRWPLMAIWWPPINFRYDSVLQSRRLRLRVTGLQFTPTTLSHNTLSLVLSVNLLVIGQSVFFSYISSKAFYWLLITRY